ncbi:ion transport 2 domain protein [Candidatus Moduliflexus flocculans]|uniref:Ion transport 2 domain protein n=1 Tax=Candidatus Moduliflexus flocculans TaxID=1499966 RepID=A0A081BMZ6_9BACT|nr:ion transport 2 domain protein [Candidatus Moduliflexus flocculans]
MKRTSLYWWKHHFRRYMWPIAACVLLVFVLASVFVMYHYERYSGEDISVFDAFRIVIVFFLGEYGETPHTLVGRVLSLVLFVLGIVVVAAFIGKFASFFIEMNMEVRMPQDLECHIVICHWHENGDRLVKELHSPLAAPDTDIIVITQDGVNEEELRASPAYEKVFFLRSDPTRHDVLRRARAHHARSVIILANPDSADPDAQTALIALAIGKLEQHLDHKPHIIAEVVDPHKVQHLIDAGVDEWVCSANYGLGLLAQGALFGKISDVYQQLLTYSADTNEMYLVDASKYPPHFLGKTFQQLSTLLNTHRHLKNPVILIGVKRHDQIILNPRPQDFDVIHEGDSLIVMSFDPPDLRHLEG